MGVGWGQVKEIMGYEWGGGGERDPGASDGRGDKNYNTIFP